jgi:hypothetical protein
MAHFKSQACIGDGAVRRRRGAPATVASLRVARAFGAFDDGFIAKNGPQDARSDFAFVLVRLAR